MNDPDKKPFLSGLLILRYDWMRYFAKDTPEMRLKALRWCLLPSILAASGWIGCVVVVGFKVFG